ncbi:uracil-DNA glycosylase family protein [Pediococcus argentinicus]|uniref:Uracil-DNA glycosylase n=1 Tax=Pediococcus argentinicus TaxID=480391 RepID=A0A0R2NIY6_9LACO|nr:uracil-DNA glycosylase family protein [Pediococcus argentinicus]KRO25308.1 Uracil-DNA glycosylase [Pediococcus argentinicus]NKZ22046.1 uracil-DNA glycosylase family protein [Pediococcus argentinicus]GEP19385.1 uracil-DNA glycosylase [Pediococcus argentinicus]
MNEKDPLFKEIKNAPENKEYTAKGWNPIYSVNPEAEILIIGQAPGKRVQDTEVMWNDKSGDRLRDWMGISRDTFYNSHKIAVIPMDFYYPGRGKSGDLPPRKGVADNWHPRLLELMPNIKLTILIGNYSQKYYLPEDKKLTTTAIVKNYQKYLPKYFPIVHPSPRNNIWLAKNPWFETDVVPELRKIVQQSL